MYGKRMRNTSQEAGWLNLPGVTQVPHVADSEHAKSALQSHPAQSTHPVLTGQKAKDRPANDSDVNAAPHPTQNYA